MNVEKTQKQFLLLVVTLVIVLVLGTFFLRIFLLNQTVQERSSQLQEMTSQMRVNLEDGLWTHWNLLTAMEACVEGKHYADEEELVQMIEQQEEGFRTDLYGCHLMLLDDTGMAYLGTGSVGIWDDVKSLVDGEYRHTFISETRNIDGIFLVFSQVLENPVTVGKDETNITHLLLLKDIRTLKKYYTTESYGGHAATYFIQNNGNLAYCDASGEDSIGARNVFKVLEQAKYKNVKNFDHVKKILDEKGIVTANMRLKSTEYYYCMASLEEYHMTLMLLIPAKYVAVNTMNMMNSTFFVETIFMTVLAAMLVLAVISFVRVHRSAQIVKIEQKNNKELNKLRLAAEDALHAAEAANRSKSIFLSNMSHDIRTPMNAVIGFATLASANVENTEKVKDCLTKILSSSNHLLSLINEILDMSRIESGKINLEETEANLSEMLRDIQNIVSGQFHDKQLEFHMDFVDVKDEDVYCDKTRLNQVFLNLVSNAIKFTPPGGTISVRVAQLPNKQKEKGLYEIRVKDTGIGMSPEFVKHIFEPFEREQTSTVSRIQGTGLGMPISKNIIDLMGGTIEVKTELGKGTEFMIRVELRLQTEHRQVEDKEESVLPPALETANFTGKHLLLVEDNELNREIALELLGTYGFQIDVAVNGKEAVDKVGASAPGHYDLVLMDIQMPVMDGYEATEQIRQLEDPLLSHIPIIAMTANAFEEDRKKAGEAGMNGFLSKPVDIKEVIRLLQDILSKK